MKKKKLSLQQLKVSSFMTEVKKSEVKGGWDNNTEACGFTDGQCVTEMANGCDTSLIHDCLPSHFQNANGCSDTEDPTITLIC